MGDLLEEIMDDFEQSIAPAADLAADRAAWDAIAEAGDDPKLEERWLPDTLDEWDWALRKLHAAQLRKADLERIKAEQIAKLAAAWDDAIRPSNRDVEFFGSMVESARLARPLGKTGNVKVASGTVSTSTREKWIWPEDEDLVAFARTEKLEVKESVSKDVIKRYVKETGVAPEKLSIIKVTGVSVRY